MKFNFKFKFDLKQINLSSVRDFYDKNRQSLLTAFIVIGGVFFIFYWTTSLIDSKKRAYISSAKASYEKLEKATAFAVKIKQDEVSGVRNRVQNVSLPSFIQNAGNESGLGKKIVNIRPMNTSGNLEHVSMRMENLFYDELIGFISRIEAYDNLRVKSIGFTRRYDNPTMIDVSMEIVLMK